MGQESDNTIFVQLHKEQLISSGIPEHFWTVLYDKLVHQNFNSADNFQILQYEQEGNEDESIYNSKLILQATNDIKKSDSQHIYLIDHAWTYRIQDAKKQLLEYDTLRERLCKVFNINSSLLKEEIVDILFNNLWKINNFYSISNAGDIKNRLLIWYVMDEVGIAVTHSDEPNCRIVPFVYINDQITYSVLFPIKDIENDELICRDFVESVTDRVRRECLLLPWFPKTIKLSTSPSIPDEQYFLAGHIAESLPDTKELDKNQNVLRTLKVYSEYDLVNSYLTNNQFVIVDNPDEAHILWYIKHFKDFKKFSETPDKFINQFPYEFILTVKDLLCITCRRSQSGLSWLPTSYNLITELGNFVAYFQQRNNESLDNYWIVKPYNLARGLDIHITNNLDYILKLSLTGPKIAQKYITNPVLFYRSECDGKVKFDVRYIILLQSVEPLKAFVYKKFFLRFANKPFELNEFQDYEKHFTVMNYTENAELKHLRCDDFQLEWADQYPGHSWDSIQNSILKMLTDILECATAEKPPCGIGHSPQSRATYAADVLLEWTSDKEIRPQILEINYTPDCQRACDYYPEFYNDIFKMLFLNEICDNIIPL